MALGALGPMRRAVRLLTSEGELVRILLENWGSGLDHSMRRWTMQDGLWLCVDSVDLAKEAVFGFRRPVVQLPHAPAAHDTYEAAPGGDKTTLMRGQTMVEYALIIAAIGAVAWGAYNVMGHDIGSMASGIDSSLTST